jgi:hypothetical protein
MKLIPVIACLLVAASAIEAHHSFAAEFDISKPVCLKGVLTRIDFSNPHTHFFLDVKDADGRVVTWVIEAASPNGLLRRGFTKRSVAEGTQVTIDAYCSKSNPHQASARDIVLPGGYIFLLGSFSEGVK